jgi:hypothetical protein
VDALRAASDAASESTRRTATLMTFGAGSPTRASSEHILKEKGEPFLPFLVLVQTVKSVRALKDRALFNPRPSSVCLALGRSVS